MSAPCFLDTNILIYAAVGMNEDPVKHKLANGIIQNERFVVSGQVLQEFYTAAQKLKQRPLPSHIAAEWVGWLQPFCEVSIDGQLVYRGIEISQRYTLSYWDGAIIAAAERAGSQVLYTEDLKHGETYHSVRAINPFHSN